ncbi:MAG: M24 family metallopeptidase, partial [Hyphomicrobiales bacterium]
MSAMQATERGFARSEFEGRLARLRNAMGERSLDLMLIDDSEILNYFTGFETSLNLYRACLVPLDGGLTMVLRQLDVAPFLEQSWFGGCVGFADTDDPALAVAAAIRSTGSERARIGVDFGSHAMTVNSFQAMQAALPQASFVAMTHVPWELRLIKSEAEIGRIARAAGIADATMLAIAEEAKPGMTTRDATAIAVRQFVDRGGDAQYVGRIAAGRGWDFLHRAVSDEPLQAGDILHVELAPSYAGYSARLMRCIVFGPIDAALARTAERLAELQDRQFAGMRPGARAGDVDRILREGVLREGLRESYPNITGYTLGYYSHQPLRSSDFTRVFHPGADWRLEPGMAFHMYTSARGISLSETVVIREAGAVRLTSLPRTPFCVSGARGG